MQNYAIYRLPFEDHFTLLHQSKGQPLVVNSIAELSGKEGFVFAPFEQSEECPIVLIEPDEIDICGLDAFSPQTESVLPEIDDAAAKESYALDFEKFHQQLVENKFSKIVLARIQNIGQVSAMALNDLERLFVKACEMYPRMFIALVSAELSGTWLMATPEILLDGKEGEWHTMALAGTQSVEEAWKLYQVKQQFHQRPVDDTSDDKWLQQVEWSQKNIEEQRYVASYITNCLEKFADEFKENGPYTVRAGNLVHLRSDFTFSMKSDEHIGDVLDILHPTPAVCGIPKENTRQFILENEHSPRKYYSGFCGPLAMEGETHLYVSLRCMEILDKQFCLHAGGGLLKDSTLQNEWHETCEKMKTMRALIDDQKNKRN